MNITLNRLCALIAVVLFVLAFFGVDATASALI